MSISQIIQKWRESTGVTEDSVSDANLTALCLCVDMAGDDPPKANDFLSLPITRHTCNLSVRARGVLLRAGYKTIGQVLDANITYVAGMKNCGKGTIEEIEKWIIDQKEAM